MHRAILDACGPWLGLTAAAVVVLALLVRLAGERLRIGRVVEIHRDEGGAAQTLSFVLTLPLFMMIMTLVVQLVQLMIGTIVVHYAAFAAARAAVVWIPALVDSGGVREPENCIGRRREQGGGASIDAPAESGVTYVIDTDPGSLAGQQSPKVQKIFTAAVLACMAIAPSGAMPATTAQVPIDTEKVAGALVDAYRGMARKLSGNPMSAQRLRNKLAYAAGHTRLAIKAYHQNQQPDAPLVDYASPPYVPWERRSAQGAGGFKLYWRPFGEFQANELGWQDSITVTVEHDLALFGSGFLLSRLAALTSDTAAHVFGPVRSQGTLTVCTLTAQTTMGLEGEKCVVPYAYP